MTSNLEFVRSWLYVPGSRPELFAKGVKSGADVVVIDLEDSVPAERKDYARQAALDFLSESHEIPVVVRINDLDSEWYEADLITLGGTLASGFRIPKVESKESLHRALHVLRSASSNPAPLIPLIESALGMENCLEIAASEGVGGLCLGEEDMRGSLRFASRAPLDWIRERFVLAVAAGGLPMPPQSVFPQLDDLDGLRADCLYWRDRGFFGRSAIHPRQIQTINDCYTATTEETIWADQVLGLYKESSENGRGALLMDGRLIDLATVRVAEKIRNIVSGQALRANRLHRKDEV